MSHETSVMKRRQVASPFGLVHSSACRTSRLTAGLTTGLFMVMFMILAATRIAGATGTNEDQTRLVVLGDSLVAGYGLAPGESFPEQLQATLSERGMNIVVENAGVSGDTTSGGLARLDWSVPDGTDIVLIELGANDALRGISPDVTRANLTAMIERLKERGIGVLLAGMQAPPNMGSDYEAQFNPIYADLSKSHDVPLYPFFLEGVAAEPELNQSDGMHPNAQGIRIIVDNFVPFLEENTPRS